MPIVFWTFLAGAILLAAIPIISAGFYSNGSNLMVRLDAAEGGSPVLWSIALSGR